MFLVAGSATYCYLSPRQGEESDEVRIRGETQLVMKIKDELKSSAAKLRDRVVQAVEVPSSHYRTLIGRGGQHLNELQNKTGAQIQFPGSRSYGQVGEAENAAELIKANPADIVKVSGSLAACEAAIAELKVRWSGRMKNSLHSYRTDRVESNLPHPKVLLALSQSC